VPALLGTILISCSTDSSANTDGAGTSANDPTLATLVIEATIGDSTGAGLEQYQFSSIAAVLELPDGTIWVADGGESEGIGTQTPLIRQFDSTGVFIRQVGREGDGPGEYRKPDVSRCAI
jgi:hypothetical protein